MKRFTFNTGVRPENVINFPYEYHRSVGNIISRTLLIPFDADAPENASLMFLCDNPNLPESKADTVIVREVFNTSLVSKYAYFRVTAM